MKPQSAKQKGRILQKWFRNLLIEILDLNPEDLESRPMGSQGEDIIIGSESRARFPYATECKNQEAVNVWKSYIQAQDNSGKYEPLLVIKRNRSLPLVVVDAKHFVELVEAMKSKYEKELMVSIWSPEIRRSIKICKFYF